MKERNEEMQNEQVAPAQLLFGESELKVYMRIIWRKLWLIILCALLGGVAAYLGSSAMTPVYQASSTLMIDEGHSISATYQDILTAERKARTYAELMTRDSTLAEVAARLSLTPQNLADDLTDISVTPLRDTQLLKVQIEGISPSLVTLVADTLPTVFIQELGQVQSQRYADTKGSLQTQLDELAGEIDLLQVEINQIDTAPTSQDEIDLARLRSALGQKQNNYARALQSFEDLRRTEAESNDSIVVVEAATQPTEPIRPRVLVNTLLATIVGIMLALGVIFLIEYLDDRIKSPRDLQQLFDLPILGAVSRFQLDTSDGHKQSGGLITMLEPRNPISEAYRGLRTNLQFAGIDKPIRSLVVTSSVPGEGKTTTASNLAVVLAQAGLSVALVDADLRKPTVHKLFGISSQPGLVDNLLSNARDEIRFSPERRLPHLHLLPSGKRPPNPSELLGSQRMAELLERLQEEVDMVIFDMPPVLAVADAHILAGKVDGVLLVANSGVNRDAVIRSVESLHQVNAPLIGFVFNRLERAAAGGYYYYYDSYYGDEEVELPDQFEPEVNAMSSMRVAAPAKEVDYVAFHSNGRPSVNVK